MSKKYFIFKKDSQTNQILDLLCVKEKSEQIVLKNIEKENKNHTKIFYELITDDEKIYLAHRIEAIKHLSIPKQDLKDIYNQLREVGSQIDEVVDYFNTVIHAKYEQN